ncbi:hypothetical protein FB451DRAFT_1429937 [Mycena latifolia]|nr:hypothetical protein FB451DRAFT_1429937 [Mycena latifolia]
MVVGPAIVHMAVNYFRLFLLALFGIPCTTRALIRELSNRRSLFFFGISICTFAFVVAYCGVMFPLIQYSMLRRDIRQLVWQSISCAQSRAEVLIVYWALVAKFRQWKFTQIEDFHEVVSVLQGSFFAGIRLCLGMWRTLRWDHKLRLQPYYTAASTSFQPPAESESGFAAADIVDDLSSSKQFLYLHVSVENRLATR